MINLARLESSLGARPWAGAAARARPVMASPGVEPMGVPSGRAPAEGRCRIPLDTRPDALARALAARGSGSGGSADAAQCAHLPLADASSFAAACAGLGALELCPGHTVEIAAEHEEGADADSDGDGDEAGATCPIVSVHLKNERSRQWLLYVASNALAPHAYEVVVESSRGEELGRPAAVSRMKNKRWKVNISNLKGVMNAQDRAQYSLFRLVVTPKNVCGCAACGVPALSRVLLFYRARVSPSAATASGTITTTNTASPVPAFFSLRFPGEDKRFNFCNFPPPPLPPSPASAPPLASSSPGPASLSLPSFSAPVAPSSSSSSAAMAAAASSPVLLKRPAAPRERGEDGAPPRKRAQTGFRHPQTGERCALRPNPLGLVHTVIPPPAIEQQQQRQQLLPHLPQQQQQAHQVLHLLPPRQQQQPQPQQQQQQQPQQQQLLPHLPQQQQQAHQVLRLLSPRQQQQQPQPQQQQQQQPQQQQLLPHLPQQQQQAHQVLRLLPPRQQPQQQQPQPQQQQRLPHLPQQQQQAHQVLQLLPPRQQQLLLPLPAPQLHQRPPRQLQLPQPQVFPLPRQPQQQGQPPQGQEQDFIQRWQHNY